MINLNSSTLKVSLLSLLFLTACGGGGGDTKKDTGGNGGGETSNNGQGGTVLPFYLASNNRATVLNAYWLGFFHRYNTPSSMVLPDVAVYEDISGDSATRVKEYTFDTTCKGGGTINVSVDTPPTPLSYDDYTDSTTIIATSIGRHPHPFWVLQLKGVDYFTQYTLEANNCYKRGVVFDGLAKETHKPTDRKERKGAGTYDYEFTDYAFARSKFRSVKLGRTEKKTIETQKNVTTTITGTVRATVDENLVMTKDASEIVYKHYRTGEKVTIKNFHLKSDSKNIYELSYTMKWSVKNKTTILELLSARPYHSSMAYYFIPLGIDVDNDFRKESKFMPFGDYELTFKVTHPMDYGSDAALGYVKSGAVQIKLTRPNAPTINTEITFHGTYATENRNGTITRYD